MRCVLLVSVLVGCGPVYLSPSGGDGDLARIVPTGSPEGVGLVAFLNDASTTLAVLDDAVPLDARAAKNLVAHRDGSDGRLGTGDDDLYGSVEEVDAVSWVGPSALDALLAYVEANGWVPAGSDVLGTWDGVTFTVDEATAVLELVNTASEDELDDDVPLDARAVGSILAARPIETVHALAGLYYVGTTALGALLDHAVPAPSCDDLSLAPGSDPAAEDLSRLLALATTGDYPYAELRPFALPGCPEGAWLDDPATIAQLEDVVWPVAFEGWDLSDLPDQYELTSPWTAGGGQVERLLDRAMSAIDDRVTDGDFDPSASAEAQALYDARFALEDAVLAGPRQDPDRYREVHLEVDASECSQEAAIRVDLETDAVLIVREFPGC